MQSTQHTLATPEHEGHSSSPSLEKLSLLSPIGHSYYASSDSLSAQFYEDLLCRGWRRSGTLLYKPNQRASCCPHYTIKLDVSAFKATKDQRQAINRFNRHVVGEDYVKESARRHPKSKQEAAKRKSDFILSERVHESERQTLKTPPEPTHDFVVTLEPDNFTEEKYTLFENYQRKVHHEPPHRITRSGFRSFLCSSPLQRQEQTISGSRCLLGSYHQCYRLDGELVAVGVLDLLPHAVSAVYFMYHESIHMWSPGKISALRETALAGEEKKPWYMMGFYIHNCKKMRYKVDYHPQYILDPESYTWDLLNEDLKRRLDARKYVSLSLEKAEGIMAPEDIIETHAEGPVDGETMDPQRDEDGSSDDEFSASVEDHPLFSRNMPGILPRNELSASLLDHIKICVREHLAETSDLVLWERSSIDDPHSIKGVIAELVAAVGTKCAREMCVYFE